MPSCLEHEALLFQGPEREVTPGEKAEPAFALFSTTTAEQVIRCSSHSYFLKTPFAICNAHCAISFGVESLQLANSEV